jgi:alpha-D-ribose 1-methylphosphonate 5-triphosphate synthase subunit PhnG
MSNLDPANAARQSRMSLLAKSEPSRLAALFSAVLDLPAYAWLRSPEIGAVMVRGRMGGTGAPFNLGEMSVTRCALTLSTGEVGHAYVQGRDKDHATRAALVDALMQTARADEVQAAVLDPLSAEMQATAQARSAKAAATKVEFFTMVRGED